MLTFTFKSRGGDSNQGQFFKTGAAKPAFVIDWSDGMLSSATISTVGAVAVNSLNATVTSNCIGTTAISGNLCSIQCLTCGTSGTVTATNGDRFKITTTATLSNGEILNYSTFVLVQEPTYDPD